MTLVFSITANDFLDYHLYMASKSAAINRKRNMAKYIFALSYLLFAIWFCNYQRVDLGLLFAALSVLWFCLYPILNKNSMRRFYAKYIDENYKKRMKRTTEMTLGKDFVSVNDGMSDSKISISEFEKLIETKNCFFLKLRSGTAYIIPKNQVEAAAFKSAAGSLGIPVAEELNWKWI